MYSTVYSCYTLPISLLSFPTRRSSDLDSDDLYSSDSSLSRMVEELKRGPYAMVIGSYTMVNFKLETIPPGLIDHREWTPDRKSTRLNSSHTVISYAVFCFKIKNKLNYT